MKLLLRAFVKKSNTKAEEIYQSEELQGLFDEVRGIYPNYNSDMVEAEIATEWILDNYEIRFCNDELPLLLREELCGMVFDGLT
jgi:hypothetical protein